MSGEASAGLMSVTEVASLMKVSPRTIWRRIAEGKLGQVRIGRLVRISESQLQSFIKSVTVDAISPKSARSLLGI